MANGPESALRSQVKSSGLHQALSSSTKPGGIFGGSIPSLALQAGHGIPGAPQPQAYSPSHGMWECASQTQRHPKQRWQSSIIFDRAETW